MVRTDSHQLRAVAGDSAQAEAVKVVTRTHKTLIWERTRHAQRLRHALRDYFPAALEAFEDLDAPDTLELLAKAPDPASAARLTTAQISAALKRARRRDIAGEGRADPGGAARRAPGPARRVTAAYAASVRALIAVLATLNEQIKALQGQVEAHFGQHPDAEIIRPSPAWDRSSAPGCSQSSATTPTATPPPRPARTTPAPAPSPAPPARRRPSLARYVHNDRLIDALMAQAFSALQASPGARAYYDQPARPRRRPQRRPAPARQPPRRHPARLPQNPHPLRRNDRLAASPAAKTEKAAA